MATFKEYQKKDGTKAWQFQAYLGVDPVTGKSTKTTRRNFKTQKEAQRELIRLQVEFEKKGLVKQDTSTFKEIYELWYENYKRTVKESTSIATERYMKIHVLPKFGEIQLSKISPLMAQKAVNEWADKLQVYKLIHQYVIKIFDYALAMELIEKNPFEKVIRPKVKRTRKEKEVKFYTTEEVKRVLNHLEKRYISIKQENLLYRYFAEWDYVMYRTLAFTGIRGGEALALTYADIDYDRKQLTINKTLSQTREGFAVSGPKTKTSNRIISLDDKTLRILKKWRLHQRELHFANGTPLSDIIFCDLDGNHSNRQALYMRSSRVAEFVGLPNIGTHGWRHSHASMLYEAGLPMKEAQVRLGHASLEITNNIYTHLSEKQKNETAEKLAKFADF
ncbi:site-specific integrase [Enterococcus hulanensis]|uniref:site-specific integrase n=1 Tax=Enterococcus hulanensis TaxID=2559929 RepID=UPI001A8F6C56|nr:site-specific integrase [Enterococcus hulanensis]MBO0456014.1 site-specific integrase [Enterococcus hulanensis]